MSKKVTTAVAVSVAVVVVGFFFLSSLITNPASMNDQTGALAANLSAGQAGSGLVTQDEVVGAGTVAQPGDRVTVSYTGKLQNGTVFDSSVGRSPFVFILGVGEVIPGWDQGVAGMKVGGKRVLIVPSSLAYGAQDITDPTTGKLIIPANSTLMFEVELLNVESASPIEGPNS